METFVCDRCAARHPNTPDESTVYGFLANTAVYQLCRTCSFALAEIAERFVDGDCTIRIIESGGDNTDFEPVPLMQVVL